MANSVRFNATLNDQVSGKLTKIRDNFDRLGKSKGAMSLLQGVGLGAGMTAFNALGSAVSGAVDFMGEAVGAASDLREAMALNQQVFEKNSDAVADWGETAADAFGMSQREALTFAANFGNAFKNVGLSLDDATAKAETMTELAGDLGSAFNASSEEAAVALRSGLLGESEPLRRFGVFLDEAKTKAKALAMGFEPVKGALTDTAKVAARYQLIMEQTAESQGMFGRDAGSLADAQKALGAELENLKAALGEDLLPVMVTFARTLKDDVVPALSSSLGAMDHLSWAMKYQRDNAEELWFWQKGLLGLWTDGQQGSEAYAAALEEQANQEKANAAWTARLTGGTQDYADASRNATGATAGVIGALGDTETAAKDAAKALDDLNTAADKLWDSLIEDTRPEQWTSEQQRRLNDLPDLIIVAKGEVAAAEKELQGARTAEEKAAARLRLRDAKREVDDLEKELKSARTLKGAAAAGKAWGYSYGSALHAEVVRWNNLTLSEMRRLDGVTVTVRGSNENPERRAGGGPVTAGESYIVGERGPEMFVPNVSGSIVPGVAAAAPVSVAVYLDSEQIAARVERRQYFAASVAPTSSR